MYTDFHKLGRPLPPGVTAGNDTSMSGGSSATMMSSATAAGATTTTTTASTAATSASAAASASGTSGADRLHLNRIYTKQNHASVVFVLFNLIISSFF